MRWGIRRGPAPELVEAGYELELADSALLERGLTLADVAHALAHPAIPDGHRRELLDALLDLRIDEPDSRYGDLVNVRELADELARRFVSRLLGEIVSPLQRPGRLLLVGRFQRLRALSQMRRLTEGTHIFAALSLRRSAAE